MGNKLERINGDIPKLQHHQTIVVSDSSITPVPWLDRETERYLRHALTLLIERRQDLQAAILYGSIARRTARPLDDPHPSDVDVLLIFTPEAGQASLTAAQRSAVSWAIVDVIDRYPKARDLQFMPTLMDLAQWDHSFIENVARDGVLLWSCHPLPLQLQAIAETHMAQADEDRGETDVRG